MNGEYGRDGEIPVTGTDVTVDENRLACVEERNKAMGRDDDTEHAVGNIVSGTLTISGGTAVCWLIGVVGLSEIEIGSWGVVTDMSREISEMCKIQ